MEKKIYRYKGFRFYASNCTTEVLRGTEFHRWTEIRPVYQIDDRNGFCVKDYAKRPFLTSIRQCREFIDEYLEDAHHA